MKIQESAENYLEAILVLMQKNGQVRSIDVAHYTGFSKPSISRAVGLLRDNGYVSIDQNGLLNLRRRRQRTPAALSMSSARRPLTSSKSTRAATALWPASNPRIHKGWPGRAGLFCFPEGGRYAANH